MKQTKYLIVAIVLTIFLVACNNNAVNNKTTNENNETTKEDDSEDMNEFFQEVVEVNDELKSYSITEKIELEDTFQDEESKFVTETEKDVIIDPFQLKEKINQEQVKGPIVEDEEFDYNGTYYIVDDEIYMQLDKDTWTVSENDQANDEIAEQTQLHLGEMIQTYKEIAEDEHVNEEENHYAFEFTMIPQQATKLDVEADVPEQDALSNQYKVNEMDVVIKVNKESKLIEEILVEKSYEYEEDFDVEADKHYVEMTEKTVIKDHNELTSIEVPEDIKDKAEKF